jgi:hypothetical protein
MNLLTHDSHSGLYKRKVQMKIDQLRLLCFVIVPFILITGCSQSPEELKKALFDAVKTEDVSTVKRCISDKANVNDPETLGGWSALHYAARSGNPQIVKMLLDAGADPNYVGTLPNQTGTALSMKPLILAQASLSLAKSAQDNPTLHWVDPNQEKQLRSPGAVARFDEVCKLLEAVTKD